MKSYWSSNLKTKVNTLLLGFPSQSLVGDQVIVFFCFICLFFVVYLTTAKFLYRVVKKRCLHMLSSHLHHLGLCFFMSLESPYGDVTAKSKGFAVYISHWWVGFTSPEKLYLTFRTQHFHSLLVIPLTTPSLSSLLVPSLLHGLWAVACVRLRIWSPSLSALTPIDDLILACALNIFYVVRTPNFYQQAGQLPPRAGSRQLSVYTCYSSPS